MYISDVERAITAQNLGLAQAIFLIVLRKLENEGLIQNIELLWAEGKVQYVGFGDMLISSYGIDYVE